MSESVRFVVHRVMGRTHRIFRWWIIDVLSVVQITAGEVRPRKPRDTSPAQDYEFIIGEADVGVTNIGPGVGHGIIYMSRGTRRLTSGSPSPSRTAWLISRSLTATAAESAADAAMACAAGQLAD